MILKKKISLRDLSEYVYGLILNSEPNTYEEYCKKAQENKMELIFTEEEYVVYEQSCIDFRVVFVYFKLTEVSEQKTNLSNEEIGRQIGAGLASAFIKLIDTNIEKEKFDEIVNTYFDRIMNLIEICVDYYENTHRDDYRDRGILFCSRIALTELLNFNKINQQRFIGAHLDEQVYTINNTINMILKGFKLIRV